MICRAAKCCTESLGSSQPKPMLYGPACGVLACSGGCVDILVSGIPFLSGVLGRGKPRANQR